MSVAVVFKSPYVKGGKAAGKAGYIARRIGVDKSINNKVVINANYIATRPKVEKFGTHGLFSNKTDLNLNEVIEELIKEDMFFDKFKNLDIENYYFTIFEEEGIIKFHKISNPEIFVISLSLDEDCLPMWNYYTKNNIGEGYALSFYKNIDNIYGNKKFI